VETPVRDRLRLALRDAMKARDAVAVGALRSALAAVDNAEAVEASPAPSSATHPGLAGTAVGLGAGEVARWTLTEAEVERVVRVEVADRRAAAREYEQAGLRERAERLLAEAGVLASHLGESAAR
jgi:uncharacterized protein YqeY